MCLVCLVYLPLLAIHIEYLISNITRGASYGTISGYLFNNLLINTLKRAKSIPVLHSALYSLSAIY